MTYIVGLTGGIGSGKTTVANKFAALGIDLIDADIIARQVVEPGSNGLKAIESKFGPNVLLENGQLNRTWLREHIFSNPEAKTWLNNLLHPMIREEMVSLCQRARSPYCLLVVPLLVENKLDYLVHRVLVVDVSIETQITRTVQRDSVSRQHVEKILQSQASREQRLAIADDIIENETNSQELDGQIAALHQKYLTLAQQLTSKRTPKAP